MIGEANFYGMYVPWLGLLALAALLGLWGVRRVLASLGAYRWIWHPALFDLGLYTLLLYGLSRLSAPF
jgi:hypothetical protein